MRASALGARVAAKGAAIGADFHRPTLRSLAGALLGLISLGAAAALFFAWLPPDASRAFDPHWSCESRGRAGEHCVRSAVRAAPADAEDCRSLGRAGRLCAAQPRE
jgi:hypothetical protein